MISSKLFSPSIFLSKSCPLFVFYTKNFQNPNVKALQSIAKGMSFQESSQMTFETQTCFNVLYLLLRQE
jgi:hypothetical protein